MFYDAILSYLGEFGPYQRRKVFLLCLISIPHGMQVCGVIFNLANSNFRCAVPGLDNDTYHIQNEAHGRMVNASVPIDSDTGQYSQCHVYATSRKWITLQWNIVCHRYYFKAHFNMVAMMGLLIGSFCGGPLSDYFGRKKLLVVTPVFHALSSVALAFTTSPIQYMILKFLTCFLSMTSFLPAFVMVAEIVGPRKRTLAEICTKYGWCVGIFLLPLLNYLIQNWRLVQLALSVPCLGFASFWWSTVSMVYYGLTLNIGSLIEGSLYVNFTVQALLETISYVVCHFLLGKVGRKPIYCGSLLLAGCACLAMTGPIFTKSSSKWINVLLLSLGKFGITGSLTLVFIVTVELLPTSVRNSGLGFCSFVGRFAGLVSPYVASLGYLMSSQYGSTFPLVIFGISGVVAGLLALFLPESRHRKLPETMEEAKRFGRAVQPNALDGTRI